MWYPEDINGRESIEELRGMPDDYVAADQAPAVMWEGAAPTGLPSAPASMPIKAPTALSTPPVMPVREPTMMEKFGTAVDKYSPVMAKAGAALLKDTGHPFAGAAGVWADTMQNERFAQAMKKATSDYLGGTTEKPTPGYVAGMLGTPPPAGKSSSSLNDRDMMGLSPEQSALVQKTAVDARSKAMNEPLDLQLKVAQIHNTIQTSNYHAAQIPLLQMQAQKALQELQMMPVKTLADLSEKNAQIARIMGDLQKLQYEIPKLQAETAETQARTAKTKEETKTVPETRKKIQKETQALDWEKSPEYAQMRAAEKRAGMALSWHNAGDKWVGTSPDGRVMSTLPISMSPDVAGGNVGGVAAGNAKMLAASAFLEKARESILAKYPNDAQKGMREFQQLRDTLKDPVTGEIDITKLRAALPPDQQALFDQSLDIFSRAFGPKSSSVAGAGEEVRRLQGGGGQPQPQPGQGTPKPGAAPRQGKAILDVQSVDTFLRGPENEDLKGQKVNLNELSKRVAKKFGVDEKAAKQFLSTKYFKKAEAK